ETAPAPTPAKAPDAVAEQRPEPAPEPASEPAPVAEKTPEPEYSGAEAEKDDRPKKRGWWSIRG
ncbi:MAG: hypothetical protein WCD16_04445, partial [Paracoccaceae bacterium]